jgi:hypothetical protein
VLQEGKATKQAPGIPAANWRTDLEWSGNIASHMHDKRRRFHFGQKISDIEISDDIEVSSGALG